MACPVCGCKVTYSFDDYDEDYMADYARERCASCGLVFDELESADDDDI
jgi:transcription initiation factor TFIIIB Brf1 subunit/transcription initiation factor TFIIB